MLSVFLPKKADNTGDLMRATTLAKKLLGIAALYATSLIFEEDCLVIAVRPRWRHPRCGRCARRCSGYDRRPLRRWRHVPIGSLKLWLEYAPRRVHCPQCGIKTEQVPWARHGSSFTMPLEEMAAYLAQITDQTKVQKLLGISWRSVGNIVERVVAERLDDTRFKGLSAIGVDEFSYRKRHNYMTVVVDHQRQRVIWTAKGKDANTLERFFDELGDEQLACIRHVTMDMSGAYIKAVSERLPQAQIVFDRFHVQQLASNALDKVRREQVRQLKGTDEAKAIKSSRFSLLKSQWNHTRKDRQRLSEIQQNNQPLYRAYLLKEALSYALSYRQPKRARRALDEWLAWASRSQLPAFVTLAGTIRTHKDGILAYIKDRQTNAFVEGINNRLRMIARRAFGFHSVKALSSMLFLCCGGIELNPPLP